MYELKLLLDKTEYIIFVRADSSCEIRCCERVMIYFIIGKNSYLIADDFFIEALRMLVLLFNEALKNKLKLHPSINQDIGYMWNRELHGDEGFVYNNNFWVGQSNLLWCTPGSANPNLATWVINDGNNIIMKITPSYRWHFVDPDEGENYISYEEFMQNYKPHFIRTIPHDVARQWIVQAKFLLKTIEENEKQKEMGHCEN